MRRPHSALVRLTGWATPTGTGVQLGSLNVTTPWRPEGASQRVSLVAYPRTTSSGLITSLHARPRLVRPASGPNSETFEVTGQLIRVDRQRGALRIKISPERARLEPFMLNLSATTAVFDQLDPDAFAVMVTGRVLHLRGPSLLAECVEVVHAPVSPRWAGHRGKRGYGAAIALAQAAQP